jgi:predicted RNA methylase
LSVLSLHEAARKKQLGQYFTGQRVGRLLAALAGAEKAKTIIDPMVGSADLLVSCLQVGATPEKLVGLELDPLAFAQAKAALDGVAGTELVLTDAFSGELPAEQFDLVITNPPYIRYQSKGEVDGVFVPTSEAVRSGLTRAIKARAALSDDARALMFRAARTYPGTSDIAVPAWILCASLVREGGMLAVVAPRAWLSRNYAHAVRELLDEAFDVEVIVEDGDASWFDDAQVRTHLVVARRRAIGDRETGRAVVLARATSELDAKGSLHGSLCSEHAVAAALRKVASSHSVEATRGLTAHIEHDLSVAAAGQAGHVPARVATALGVDSGVVGTRTLESYGWRAGQGLRTGANDFFYVSVVDGVVRPAARWGIRSLAIPPECLLPAVRRQSEVGEELVILANQALPSRIINLRGWVTATDKKRMGAAGDVRVLPPTVAKWIAQVAASPLSDRDSAKLFPDLAAVAPNVRMDRSGRPVGFWYQLPELAPRHRPALFVGRVCGGQPTTYANSANAVIDANFSTLWPTTSDALPAEALHALLHSSWVWANLEATCTVLGGGALKVEATDLRRLALPDLAAEDIDRLAKLGRALLKRRAEDLVLTVDEVVASSFVPGSGDAPQVTGLRVFAEKAFGHRSRH